MSLPNFFKRRGLLSPPGAPEADGGAPPSEGESETAEVFTRPTVIPDGHAVAKAVAAMRTAVETDAAVTAPAPRQEYGTPTELESQRGTPRVEADENVLVVQLPDAPSLLDGLPTHAIPPPARVLESSIWQHGNKATGRTLSDLTLELGALDFVDGHPRSTNRPGPGHAEASLLAKDSEIPGAGRTSITVSVSELYAVGDFSGALELAERTLKERPRDETALRYAEDCRRVLLKMCEARIGQFTQRPTVVMGPEQVRWLALDHREGFLMSLIDGSSSVDDLLDISGMQRLDALRIFAALIDKGVVKMRPS